MMHTSSASTEISLDDCSSISVETPPPTNPGDLRDVAPWDDPPTPPLKGPNFSFSIGKKRTQRSMGSLSPNGDGGPRSRPSEASLNSQLSVVDSTKPPKASGIIRTIKRTLSKPNLRKQSSSTGLPSVPQMPPSLFHTIGSETSSPDSIYSNGHHASTFSLHRPHSPIHAKMSMKNMRRKRSQGNLAPPLPSEIERPPPVPEFSMEKIQNVSIYDIVKDYTPEDRRLDSAWNNYGSSGSNNNDDIPAIIDITSTNIPTTLDIVAQDPSACVSFKHPFETSSAKPIAVDNLLSSSVPSDGGGGVGGDLQQPAEGPRSFGSTGVGAGGFLGVGVDNSSWAAPESWAVPEADLENAPVDHPSSDEEDDESFQELAAVLCPEVITEEKAKESVALYNRKKERNAARTELLHSPRQLESSGSSESSSRDDKTKGKYLIRVDRDDRVSYHVISCYFHTSVQDLLKVLRKKIFMLDSQSKNDAVEDMDGVMKNDTLEPHRLYLRERGRERLLAPTERPAAIVRRRLEQAGYVPSDGFEQLGISELPFLLRFVYRSEQLGKPLRNERYMPDIPPEPQVISFDLSQRGLRAIPTICYQHISRIGFLDLSKNPLLEIPLDFAQQCESLVDLKLCHMTMKKVPQSVRHITSLKSLDISCNRLSDIDEAGLELLPNLTQLEMHNNRIDHFPALKNVSRLNISNNKFDSLPEAVCEMSNLQHLDISFNTISELPSGLGNLSKLRKFILVGNQVSEFPPECDKLVKLTELDCRRNNITDLTAICKLPELEVLRADYNTVSALDLSFGPRFSRLEVTNNDITRLTFIPGSSHVHTFSLKTLDISHAKLSSLNDFALAALTSLTTLRMSYNSFRSLPDAICQLRDLQVLSCTDNELDSLPTQIGSLQKLEVLDLHNNNLTEVPPGIWQCGALRSINMTSNLIRIWHDPPQVLENEDGTKTICSRTPWDRKMSASTLANGWQTSQAPQSQPQPQPPPLTRSLKELYLGDNRLEDDVFHPLNLLKELIVLNLSFNEIQEIPPFWLQSLSQLQRLYLSGNKLTSLPSENLYHMAQLTELFLNGNKLQTLPKELASLKKLAVIDVGSNLLKYNINNHEFDWNWNNSPELRYLNLSGNDRLVIKPDIKGDYQHPLQYSVLTNLRVLGLIGVRIDDLRFREETTDFRRVRLTRPTINGMAYGIADMLGNHTHIGMFDMVHSGLQGREREDECLFGMFGLLKPPEGRELSLKPFESSSNSIGQFLCQNFADAFVTHLVPQSQPVSDALRRTFLSLNMNLYDHLTKPKDARKMSTASSVSGPLPAEHTNVDIKRGAEAVVVYMADRTMYVANLGKALAVVSRQGTAHVLSMDHDPFDRSETARIRAAEGWVSTEGLVNGEVDTARSFGYYHVLPAVNSRPEVREWQLSKEDEFVIIANRGLWNYITYQTAVDIARNHRDDPMIAAQKLRDFAMSYGAVGSTMIMVIRVSDRFRPEGPVLEPESLNNKRRARKDEPLDRTIARLDPEVEPPRGHLTLVFTDIRNSTLLWDKNAGMATAIKLHHNLLRRLLRMTRGYEVKTEGDAFMVSFSDVLSAVHWCFMVQVQLLHEPWPLEILESEDGKEIRDSRDRLIARGLSVRMGIHCGLPYCERDPVTRRMDYLGPMVNRCARINQAAAGGQILCSKDIIREITERVLERDPNVQLDAEEMATVEALESKGIRIKYIGEKRMKGIQDPEPVSLIFPQELEGRLELEEAQADALPEQGVVTPPKPSKPSTGEWRLSDDIEEDSTLSVSAGSSMDSESPTIGSTRHIAVEAAKATLQRRRKPAPMTRTTATAPMLPELVFGTDEGEASEEDHLTSPFSSPDDESSLRQEREEEERRRRRQQQRQVVNNDDDDDDNNNSLSRDKASLVAPSSISVLAPRSGRTTRLKPKQKRDEFALVFSTTNTHDTCPATIRDTHDTCHEDLASQVRQVAMICFRLEALSSNRVLSSTKKSSSKKNIFCVDPELLLPPLKGRSQVELASLLDSFSVRISNALTVLQQLERTFPL